MISTFGYQTQSAVDVFVERTLIGMVTNFLRPGVHLDAALTDPLSFRDAMLALHDCARSELYVSAREVEARQLDPVVTVTKHELFFEAFSLDESTYARVTLRGGALAAAAQTAGCTNIDFSPALRTGLEQIRARSETRLRVSPEGLAVRSDGKTHTEQRIELPDSWVHGFCSVQAALRAPAVRMTLHAGDLANLIAYLKGRKETVSPRSLRFQLVPGAPPSVTVEPWGEQLIFHRSEHEAREAREIRVWGRRRLLLLQRALPAAQSVQVLLQGTGLPSFWRVELDRATLLLGLSPWTERDWTADAIAIVEPLAFSPDAVEHALELLVRRGCAFADELADAAGAPAEPLLDQLCLQGRVLYDLDSDLYYARRLFDGEPPPPPAPRDRLAEAERICGRRGIPLLSTEDAGGRRSVRATVKGRNSYVVTAVFDGDRLVKGACACPFSVASAIAAALANISSRYTSSAVHRHRHKLSRRVVLWPEKSLFLI